MAGPVCLDRVGSGERSAPVGSESSSLFRKNAAGLVQRAGRVLCGIGNGLLLFGSAEDRPRFAVGRAGVDPIADFVDPPDHAPADADGRRQTADGIQLPHGANRDAKQRRQPSGADQERRGGVGGRARRRSRVMHGSHPVLNQGVERVGVVPNDKLAGPPLHSARCRAHLNGCEDFAA